MEMCETMPKSLKNGCLQWIKAESIHYKCKIRCSKIHTRCSKDQICCSEDLQNQRTRCTTWDYSLQWKYLSLQQKHVVLTCWSTKPYDIKRGATTILREGRERRQPETIFRERNTEKIQFPWVFSQELKNQDQESKFQLGFLHFLVFFL